MSIQWMSENLCASLGSKRWPGAGCHLRNNTFFPLLHALGHGRRLYIPWTVLVAAVVQPLLYDVKNPLCDREIIQSFWEKEWSALGQQNSSDHNLSWGDLQKRGKVGHKPNESSWKPASLTHINVYFWDYTESFRGTLQPGPICQNDVSTSMPQTTEKTLRFPSHFKT